MIKKLTVLAPCLAMLGACNEVTTADSIYGNLQNAPAASVVLRSGTPAEASSLAELIAINFTDSPVGSLIRISEGEFAGVSITKVDAIGGKTSVKLSTPDEVEISTALIGTIEADLKASIQLIDVAGKLEEDSEVVNGNKIEFYTDTKSLGTTGREYDEMSVGNEDNGVSATVKITEIAGDTSLVVGARRYFEAVGESDSYIEKTSGVYTYKGLVTVFSDEASYTSRNNKMTVDFGTSSGRFEAGNFELDQDGGVVPNKTINNIDIVALDLTLNNSTGFISSAGGAIKVDGTDGAVDINGVLSANNDAVAGAIVATEAIDGIVGGGFVLPQVPVN